MVLTSKKNQTLGMKRSKSFNPILVSKCNPTLTRQRSFIDDKEKHSSQQKSGNTEIKLEKFLIEAEESFQKGEYENALMKFSKGFSMKSSNDAFAAGVQKSRLAILNDLKQSGDSIQLLKNDPNMLGDIFSEEKNENFAFDLKSMAMQNAIQKISRHPEISARSENANSNDSRLAANFKQKSLEQLYNLKIYDGSKYKIVSATTQDIKEYMKDKDYFKMKEQNAKEWKKLRSKMNKKIAEKEAIQRYEQEAKLLEEKNNIRHYCEEQITLIGRYYQNSKISDVIRFSENFIKYLNKKPDKLLPRKWVYLATAFNYIGRAYIEQENFEKAKIFGEKLHKIAVSSGNTELISQSYILSGKIYVKFRMFQEAASVWQKLIPLTENHERKAWLFHEIGRCYFEMGNYDMSYKYGTDSAHWAELSSSSSWICSAKVLQGQCEMKRNNHRNALKCFEEAKAHAEVGNDTRILKYIESIEEILTIALNKRMTANSDTS